MSELDAAAAEPILRAWPARIPKGAKIMLDAGGAGRHAGVVRSARGPLRGVPHRDGVTDHPAHRGASVPDHGTFLLLVAGGLGAGLSGTMAGLASLFSYPALLAAGLPAVAANVTNTVALTATSVVRPRARAPSSPASGRPSGASPRSSRSAARWGRRCCSSRRRGRSRRWCRCWSAGAAAVLLFQPRIRAAVLRARAADDADHRGGPLVLAGILAVGVYGGYFGAAAGVMLLALLLVALPVSLLQGNAIKNVLLGRVERGRGGRVRPVRAGRLVGGAAAGPRSRSWAHGSGRWLARRLPPRRLRVGIALAGFGLAIVLAVDAW